MILQNIRELLKNCLDLRWNVQALERKDFREEEKDYVIMYRRLEIDLKKSLYVFSFHSFQLFFIVFNRMKNN